MKSFQFSTMSVQCSVFSVQQKRRAASARYAGPRSPLRARSGLSLIEVLASIGVLTVGILSLAALLPVGQVTIFEAIKADRAGTCGRAAMRDIIVHRMLDYHNWCDSKGVLANQATFLGGSNYSKAWFNANWDPTANIPLSFIIDPLGVTSGSLNSTLGYNLSVSGSQVSSLTTIPRITLAAVNSSGQAVPYSPTTAASVFRSADDLAMPLPEKMSPPQTPGRPLPNWDTVTPNMLQSQGDYTWFLTVSPDASRVTSSFSPGSTSILNPKRFTVSIVVCYRRVFNAAAEQAVAVSFYWDSIVVESAYNLAQGGGTIVLKNAIGGANGINVRENDWVALTSSSTQSPNYGLCRWYRVAAIGDDTSQLTLSGPDWLWLYNGTSDVGDMVVALGTDVVGVYTTTVDLDTDTTWKN